MGSLVSAAWGWKGMTCWGSPPPSQVRDSPLCTPRRGQWITDTKIRNLLRLLSSLLHQFHCCYCYQDDILWPAANEPCLSPWKEKKEAKHSQPIPRMEEWEKSHWFFCPSFCRREEVWWLDQCCLLGGMWPDRVCPTHLQQRTSRGMQTCKPAQWKLKLSTTRKHSYSDLIMWQLGHNETGAVSKERFCYLY